MSQVDIVGVQHYTPGIGHPKTSAPANGSVLALNEVGQIVTPSGHVLGGGVVQGPANSSIELNSTSESVLSPLYVTAPTSIVVSGAELGARASMVVVANGVDVPAVSGAAEWSTSFGYLNTEGVPNLLTTWYDGVSARYAWSQAQSPVSIGAFVLDNLVDISRSGETYTAVAAPAGGWGIARSSSFVLRSGDDGWISIKREVGANEFFILAFHTTNGLTSAGAPSVQVQFNSVGEIRLGRNIQIGAAPNVVGSHTSGPGRRYRLGRSGTVWSIQTSGDYGVTWSTVHVVSDLFFTGDMYPYLIISASRQATGLRQSGLT